jgi:hypothetical protein
VSGPKSVSYAVDTEALRQEREAARLASERRALAERERELAAQIRAEAARHGDSITAPPRLATLSATGTLDEQSRAVVQRRAELEGIAQRLQDEAARARRRSLAAVLDAVVQPGPATDIAADRSVERMRRRQVAQATSDEAIDDLRATVTRLCERLRADADPDDADRVVRLAAICLAENGRQARLTVDELRAAVDGANARVVASAARLAVVEGWQARLAGIETPGAVALSDQIALVRRGKAALAAAERERIEQAVAAVEAQAERDFAFATMASTLDELGYDVGESFGTVLVEDGFTDVRRADWPGYAVRIRAGSDGRSLRFNVVRGRTGAPTVRDNEVEVAWCSSLGDLRHRLRDAGVATELTSALPPGSVPLQVVEEVGLRPAARTVRRSLNQDVAG